MSLEPAFRRRAVEAATASGARDPRVVEAMAAVPRHLFVDEALRARSYANDALPIGYGQTISKLSTVSTMTEALSPRPSDRILEVGTGSGYQAAVLAHLAGQVYSVERIPALALRARHTLHRIGIFNVHIRVGDGALGWPSKAPFDGILVTAAAQDVPAALLDQLAPGGRLILPLKDGSGERLCRIVAGADGGWEEQVLEPCRFVPLV